MQYDHSHKSTLHTLHNVGSTATGLVSLLDFLCRFFPSSQRGDWQDRDKIGCLYISGKPARLTDSVPVGARVDYYELPWNSKQLEGHYPPFKPEYVVYRDDDAALVFKPAGLPTMAVREQSLVHLKRFVDDYFERTTHFPSRLDVPASGLVLVSLSSRMNRHFQKLFEKGLLMKRYVLGSSFRASWTSKTVETPIGRNTEQGHIRVPSTDGESALTHFRHIGFKSDSDSPAKFFYSALPVTGRTHQIRVHASAEGLPIIGDPLYGAERNTNQELHLCCEGISFRNPWTSLDVDVQLPEKLYPGWLKGLIQGE